MTNKVPAAGIYFSHYECFGHTSRIMAVGEVFKKRFPQGSLFFIQAGLPQPRAQIGRLGRLYALPDVFMDRRNFKEPIRGGVAFDQRSQMCVNIVTSEKPDLFVTEFFPLGREECRHELITPLARVLKQGARLWGVAGYPLLTGTNHQWREKILRLYEKILIFSPVNEKELIAERIPSRDERKRYLDFFKKYASKIVFAGYLLPEQDVVSEDENCSELSVPKGACRVAVVRGGGAYYPQVIVEAIRASELLGKDYHLTVVAGPSTTPREWYLFTRLLEKKKINNVLLLRSLGDYEGLIKHSDVCVSVGSYHSSVMLLKHRKKAVIVPFEGEGIMSFHEQTARAVLLKETIGARILPIGELTDQALGQAIRDMAASRTVTSKVPKGWFNGADSLEENLTGLFGR